MVEVDTFLTTLSVMGDDFCKTAVPCKEPPGPQAIRSRSEVVTWASFGPWQACASARGFARYARRHRRMACPQGPTREQRNRQIRQQHDALVAFFLHLVQLLAAQPGAYEALDSSGGPTRAAKRRGPGGGPGLADMGWRNRLGGDAGVHLLTAVTPGGVVPAWAVGQRAPQPNRWPRPLLPCAAGRSQGCPVWAPPRWALVDKGCEGQANHATWRQISGAQGRCPPKRNRTAPWPQALRRWWAGIRQIVATVYDNAFIPFAWIGSGLRHSADFDPVWRQR